MVQEEVGGSPTIAVAMFITSALLSVHVDFVELTESIAHIETHIGGLTEVAWAHLVAYRVLIGVWTFMVLRNVLSVDNSTAWQLPF